MFLYELFEAGPVVVRPQGGGKIAGKVSLTPGAVKKRNTRTLARGGTLSHRGYPCTKDCSGHVAGDQWAQNHAITDPNQCPYGSSSSFWEGCKSEAESNK